MLVKKLIFRNEMILHSVVWCLIQYLLVDENGYNPNKKLQTSFLILQSIPPKI